MLDCSDVQALDLLSSDKAPTLRLRRVQSMQYSNEHDRAGQSKPLAHRNPLPVAGYKDEMDDVVDALWWPEAPPGGNVERATEKIRVLQGELHLQSSLYPTTHLGHFSIKVSEFYHRAFTTKCDLLPAVYCGPVPAEHCRFHTRRRSQGFSAGRACRNRNGVCRGTSTDHVFYT